MKSLIALLLLWSMNWLMNFSELTYNTTLAGCDLFISLPMDWARCVFPRPTPPYITNGLKELAPGFSATVLPARRATLLQSPSIKDSNVYTGLSWASICIFFNPGMTKGFFTGLFIIRGKSISLLENVL